MYATRDISTRNGLGEKLPEDPSLMKRQIEREAMQEKLDNFLHFKKHSKKLARENQK